MALKKVKFLLDENVPLKLRKTFTNREIQCLTIKEMGWLGIKNSELASKVQKDKFILGSRDKDFTFLWKKFKIQVIYLLIEPATLKFIQPRISELLDNWEFDLSKPSLLILQQDIMRYWQ